MCPFALRSSLGKCAVAAPRFGALCAAMRIGSLLLAMALPVRAAANAPDHAIVSSFERHFVAEGTNLEAGGRLLLGELNCLSCHHVENPQAVGLAPKQAPILTTLGTRTRMAYFVNFLLDPHGTKPGVTMPNVLAQLPENERPAAVEALVNFLATTGNATESGVLSPLVLSGETIYHSVGCAACHGSRIEGAPALAGAVPLGNPARKYTLGGLTGFLQNPLAARPSGRMPHMQLAEGEARDVASFLMRELAVPSALAYAYYEGSWEKLPDFGSLEAKATGIAEKIDPSYARSDDHFGLRFIGKLAVPESGDYKFFLFSDDGSRLTVGGKVAADHDGIHGGNEKSGKLKLTAGVHDFTVDFFEQAGGAELKVEVQGPKMPRQGLERLLWIPPPTAAVAAAESFVPNPALAAKGAALFSSLGCASCHELKHNNERIATTLAAPAAVGMKTAGGCLAEQTAGKAPRYALSAKQRQALAAALAGLKKDPAAAITAQEKIAHGLATFNCTACHERQGVGGPAAELNALFVSTQPEMGDEGRLPPPLTGVGGKLKTAYLKRVLEQGAKDRPYVLTRMPGFGSGNATHLAAPFEEVDKLPPLAAPAGEFLERQTKAAGREMVGEKGYSCLKCHTWGSIPSGGVQAMSLTIMHERLREEWFRRYVIDPPAFRPGTRMPSAWPDGQALIKKHFEGHAEKQVYAVWQFLTDGPKAAMPSGYVIASMELMPHSNEAILYRNFIEGAGPRAIGVGYPEQLNLAWDANAMRLALLWQDSFIDAKKHWTDRGSGFQAPAGQKVLALVDGPPLAQLPDANTAWPVTKPRESGFVFRGYQLDERQRPTFRFTAGELVVTDFPEAVEDFRSGHFLRRTLTVKGPAPPSNLYFRAAAGSVVAENGVYHIDGKYELTLRPLANSVPLVRPAAGKQELLVPLPWVNGESQVVLEYRW